MAVINTSLNNNKYEWIKQCNQKTEIVKLEKKKQDLPLCYLLESHFKFKDTNRLKVKG